MWASFTAGRPVDNRRSLDLPSRCARLASVSSLWISAAWRWTISFERVANLPEHTVLFLFSSQVDVVGRSFQPLRACELLTAAANRPLFSLQRHELGCGITGGLLRDFRVAGRLLGERALRWLDGEAITDATVPADRYSDLVFDARQLKRWNIDEGPTARPAAHCGIGSRASGVTTVRRSRPSRE